MKGKFQWIIVLDKIFSGIMAIP